MGSAALVNTASGPLLVARTAADARSAVTATCTHEGCTITAREQSFGGRRPVLD